MADIEALKRAFAACTAAVSDPDDPDASSLSWLTRELGDLISKKWSLRQAFASTDLPSAYEAYTAEVGAKLSASTQTALKAAIDLLTELLSDPAADNTMNEAVKATIQDFVGSAGVSESTPTTTDKGAPITDSVPRAGSFGESVTIPTDATPLLEHATVIREVATANSESAPAFDMLIIREGTSKNRVRYPKTTLEASVPLLEGRPLYVDHNMPDARGQIAPRSLASKGGWWTNVRWETDIPVKGGVANGLVGQLNVLSKENSPVPWLAGMIRESLERGAPEQVGISIVAAAVLKLGNDINGPLKEATEIKLYASADAVAEPGAGGQPIQILAHEGVDQDIMDLSKLSKEELMAARPDLFEGAPPPAAGTGITPPVVTTTPPVVVPPAVTASISEGTPAQITQLQETMNGLQQQLAVQGTQALVESKLAAVPQFNDVLKNKIRARFAGQVVEAAAIDAAIIEYDEVAKAAFNPDANFMPPGAIMPFGRMQESVTPLDMVVAAIDDMFGNPDPKMAGKFQPIRSIKEFFAQVTGDWSDSNNYDKSRSVIGSVLLETLPGASTLIGAGTVTMANLLGTSINRAVVKLYDAQPKWWESLVKQTTITNFKTQERILLHNFGSLTQRTIRGAGAGAEYTELTWGETKETFAPSVYGNIVTVTREAIIDDDLNGIAVIPELMAQSAAMTLNEYVATFWTANSGQGPAMSDSENVFSVAHNNLRTALFSRSEVLNMRQDVMKQTNSAGKRIGIIPRFLLTPIELEVGAWALVNSTLDPTSANHEANILANAAGGLRQLITPPQFTNADRYYVHADPAQIVGIELGFLNGNKVPQLLSQTDPRTGLVFTNDVISHRVRFEFGGGWLDYRAGAAQLPS